MLTAARGADDRSMKIIAWLFLVPLALLTCAVGAQAFTLDTQTVCSNSTAEDCVGSAQSAQHELLVLGAIGAGALAAALVLIRRHPGVAMSLGVIFTGVILVGALACAFQLFQAPMRNPM
jgi:hypothetical protein